MREQGEIVLLKELCEDFKSEIVDGPFGSNLKRVDYTTSGKPVLKIQNISPFKITLKKMDYVNEQKYSELKRHSYSVGDIIMTKLGDPLGASAIVEDLDDGLIVADLVRIRAKKVNTKYLCYHLNSPITNDFINSKQKGTTRPRVRIADVRELPIYIPSLPEQKRIVEILDEAFEAIDQAKANIEKNIQNAEELFQSKLNEVFSLKGEGWVINEIGEVCELYQGLAINKKTKHLLVQSSSLPLLRIKDLKNNSVSQYVAEKGFPEKARVYENDIIYTRTGSLGLVFRGKNGVLHNNSFRVVPDSGISKDFLFWWLQNPNFKGKILSLAKKMAQPDITHRLFKKQQIIIPPLSIQNELAIMIDELFDYHTELIKSYRSKIEALDDLKNSILQKAFSGELTRGEPGFTGFEDEQDKLVGKATEPTGVYKVGN